MSKSQFFFILGLVAAVLLTVFAMFNAAPVEINLLFTSFKASQALVVILSAALGAILVTFFNLFKILRMSSDKKSLLKENEKLRNQIKFQNEGNAAKEKEQPEAAKEQ